MDTGSKVPEDPQNTVPYLLLKESNNNGKTIAGVEVDFFRKPMV